jgi:tetratricopeptide (TPR) repeat protein
MLSVHFANKIFMVLGLAAVFMCVHCAPGRAASSTIDDVKVHLLSGEYKAAISDGEKMMAGSSYSQETAELYYLLGLAYLKDGNHLRASDIFEIILKEFKDSRFKEEAELGLGDSYFLRGEYIRAKEQYSRLVKDHPRSKLLAAVYYRQSRVAAKLGNIKESKEYLAKIAKSFPLSLDVLDNEEISTGSGSGYYSVQVGAFSQNINAGNLVEKLKKRGYSAYVEESGARGKATYRVKVGKYPSRSEAISAAKKLSRDGFPTKISP